MLEVDSASKDWSTLIPLLDQALDLCDEERRQWIEDLPPQYDALRPRLRDLLAHPDTGGSSAFLQTIPKFDLNTSELDPFGSTPVGVPNYRIDRRLSEGGMGTVWLAYRTDVMVNRPVALKLPRGSWPGGTLAERLAQEREILAALDHPNIARLYDAGIASDGQPYLALEYVAGQPIDEYVKSRQLPIRARLQLFLQVERAVAHAHSRLIVHRDLKPSNVLVTEEGDVKLLDFGIAGLNEGLAADEKGARLLTPDYASPEQIAGDPLGVATDVYSSGVVLYELLTGVRPGTPVAGARDSRPARPSDRVSDPAIRRALAGDLDAIVLKALERRPERRYATIDAFAEDLDRYLGGYPVLARPGGTWYRVSKGFARHKIAVGAAAAILAALLGGAAVAIWQARIALAERAQALEVRDFLITLFQDASPYNGSGRAMSAVDWLRQVRMRADRLDNRPALRLRLLNIVGNSLLLLQDTSAAEDVLAEAVLDGQQRLGPAHPETLRARVLMLGVHRFRGRTKELRAEVEQLLPILRSKRRVLAEDLVIALKNQAHLEIDEGHYEAAERAAEEGLAVARESLASDHPEAVAAVLMRALAYQYSRSPAEALGAAEIAYQEAVAAFPDSPRHPRKIEGRLLYGRALAAAGQTARGVEELQKAVDDAAAVFGPSSRIVGFFSVSLAKLQLEAGRVADSLETSNRAVDIIARHTNPQSVRFADAIHLRGTALLAAGRPHDALPDLARAAETMAEMMTAEHALARRFQADHALALALAGQSRRARNTR